MSTLLALAWAVTCRVELARGCHGSRPHGGNGTTGQDARADCRTAEPGHLELASDRGVDVVAREGIIVVLE
jgi:hypothetical protein